MQAVKRLLASLTERQNFLAAQLYIIGCAAALRIAAARGDLWMDEVWSLDFVSRIHSPGEVFWGINSDNNHFLTSLWMYAVGQNASVLLYRLPSVIFSILTVPAAGYAVRRHGRLTVLVTELIFAVSFVMVEFGSQARGYGGLILFSILALDIAYTAVQLTRRARFQASLLLGLWVCLGVLSHPLMLITYACLGLWVVALCFERRNIFRSLRSAALILLPGLLFCAPLIASIYLCIRLGGIGVLMPWDRTGYWTACVDIELASLGLFSNLLILHQLMLVGLLLFALFRLREEPRRGSLLLLACVIVPALIFCAHLPNTRFPRYFLPFDTIFMLCVAESIGSRIAGKKPGFYAAMLVLAAIMALNMQLLGAFLATGRGHYAELFSRIAESGTVRYGTTLPGPVRALMNHYETKKGIPTVEIPREKWCDTPPDWLFLTDVVGRTAKQDAKATAHACGLVVTPIPMPAFTMSWPNWYIYQLQKPGAPGVGSDE